jgi:chromosomal replication initiation ATPase DnaA
MNSVRYVVLWHFGICEADFYSSCRRQDLVMARVLVSYLLLSRGYGLSDIGRFICRRHCSVSHYKKIIRYDSLFERILVDFSDAMVGFGIHVPQKQEYGNE